MFKPKPEALVGAHYKQFGNPRLECKLQEKRGRGRSGKALYAT